MLFDDALDIRRLMSGRDDEVCGVAPDALVLRNSQWANPLETERVRTLADQSVDQVGASGTWSELDRDLGDPLVDLTEDGLVLREPGEARFGLHEQASPRQ